jgi:MSHA biogenesis protein MshJ
MIIFNRWLALCARFDALVVRERMLLVGSLLAGIYLIFDTLLIMPASKEIIRLESEITAVSQKVDQLATEKKVFDQVAQRDPDANLKRERLKLQGKLLQLEGNLDDLSLRLVPSERMPEILRTVSEQADKVKLRSLETISPEVIDLSGKSVHLKSLASLTKDYLGNTSKDNSREGEAPAEKVYRHAIHLQIEGSYFEVVSFLKEIESLSWRFYWEGLDYKVAKFPNALVDIELYTLSMEEGMLGGG